MCASTPHFTPPSHTLRRHAIVGRRYSLHDQPSEDEDDALPNPRYNFAETIQENVRIEELVSEMDYSNDEHSISNAETPSVTIKSSDMNVSVAEGDRQDLNIL